MDTIHKPPCSQAPILHPRGLALSAQLYLTEHSGARSSAHTCRAHRCYNTTVHITAPNRPHSTIADLAVQFQYINSCVQAGGRHVHGKLCCEQQSCGGSNLCYVVWRAAGSVVRRLYVLLQAASMIYHCCSL